MRGSSMSELQVALVCKGHGAPLFLNGVRPILIKIKIIIYASEIIRAQLVENINIVLII